MEATQRVGAGGVVASMAVNDACVSDDFCGSDRD